MIEKESSLFFRYFNQLFFGTALIPQIVFSELCISAKMVVAPKMETPRLTMLANADESVRAAFSIMPRSVSTTSFPRIGSNCTYS